MSAQQFMFIAGEPSGDLLAAELVQALKRQAGRAGDVFFGAGGPQLASAGVNLAFDMTEHAVIGLWEVIKNYGKFRRLFRELLELACERKPDVIVCVDFSGFNRRFAHAVRERVRKSGGDWRPRIVQYVSPQVWASRPGRAQAMATDFDLVLSIFPFENDWYARRVPALRVEFVGHPICDRYRDRPPAAVAKREQPLVLLLPGSRTAELKRHLPPMIEAACIIRHEINASFRILLPNDSLAAAARRLIAGPEEIALHVGSLPESLEEATIAIASTGTVTMECAFFRVPAVTLYKTSWLTYQIGKRVITVSSLTMPNLLAGENVFPEFVQHDATGRNLAGAALELLRDPSRRRLIGDKLGRIVESLGGAGASQRAADAILRLADQSSPAHSAS